MENEVTVLVEVPLTIVQAGVTPGYEHIRVVDVDTKTVLTDVTRVNTEAGLAWRRLGGHQTSHPWCGRYRVMCPPEVLERFKEIWSRWK